MGWPCRLTQGAQGRGGRRQPGLQQLPRVHHVVAQVALLQPRAVREYGSDVQVYGAAQGAARHGQAEVVVLVRHQCAQGEGCLGVEIREDGYGSGGTRACSRVRSMLLPVASFE